MNLFPVEDPIHVISEDGIVLYYGDIIRYERGLQYFEILNSEVQWQHDKGMLYGKKYKTKRKVAWYGDKEFTYSYSHEHKVARPWIDPIIELKAICEDVTGSKYNACLLNLYHSGDEGMSWHSDNEKILVPNGSIASLSLGAERKFAFKHRVTKEKKHVILESGSLIEMKGDTQKHWLHALPKSRKVKAPRINLTFRQVKV